LQIQPENETALLFKGDLRESNFKAVLRLQKKGGQMGEIESYNTRDLNYEQLACMVSETKCVDECNSADFTRQGSGSYHQKNLGTESLYDLAVT
jgi:hypothetical protein